MRLICTALGLAIIVALSGTAARAAQMASCVTAEELVLRVRRELPETPTQRDLDTAIQNLRRATDMCPGLGDAYYFLSVLGIQAKHPSAGVWRQRAAQWKSAALATNAPVHLADGSSTTPAALVPPTSTSPAPTRPAPVPVKVSPYVQRKLALVVGISRFQDSRINSLKYTARDAEAVGDALKTCCGFDDVRVLLDEDATRRNLADEIDQLAKIAQPDDLVVLYVSSHGSPENLDTAGVNYIVTHDTEVTNLYSTAYGMDELLRALRDRIKAERVVAFLDTCYSGGTYRELPPGWSTNSRSLTPETGVSAEKLAAGLAGSRSLVLDSTSTPTPGRQAQGVGRVIITSSSQAERSWEDDTIKHGYFTYFLLDALKQPGLLSVDDVFGHVRVRVPDAVRKDKKEQQHPMIVRSQERVTLYLRDIISKQ